MLELIQNTKDFILTMLNIRTNFFLIYFIISVFAKAKILKLLTKVVIISFYIPYKFAKIL